MKKFLVVFTLLFFGFSVFACEERTSIETTTSLTTVSETDISTSTETISSTETIDFSSIEVKAYSSNNLLELSDISDSISSWDSENSAPASISVDDLISYQTYYGAGAALTYSSAYVISESPDRNEIIHYLFSEEGLHLQLIRLTIGASDFVASEMGHYTYDDTPSNVEDLTLDYFSIENDRIIIDLLQEALAINPDIVFIAAPWSAPAWMKNNKSLYGGTLRTDYFNAYANYLVKYIITMQEEGIDIHYLSIQNEPYYAAVDYPGMTWTIDTTKIFIRDFLGPKLVENELQTKLMIWDHNPEDNSGNLIDFPVRVLLNDATASFIDAIGVHCYTGDEQDMKDYLTYLSTNNPEVEVFMTECTATTTYQNRENNIEWSIRRMYTSAYNLGAVGTTYWNLALDPEGLTHLGGCDTCTGLISVPLNQESGYTLEADGYVSAHFSKDILSGAKRILTSSNNSSLLVSGFVDENKKITLVVFNDGPQKTTSIVWQNNTFLIVLPSNSLTTITGTKPS